MARIKTRLLSNRARTCLNDIFHGGMRECENNHVPVTIVFIPQKRQSLAYAANRSYIHGTDQV
jgi:hypothetical protein